MLNLSKRARIILMIISILILCTVTLGAVEMNQVTLIDNNISTNYSTNADTVADFLNENNIEVTRYDKVTPSVNTKLEANNVITIERAISVNIIIDGEETQVNTSKATVGELLDEKHVVLNENDLINWGNNVSLKEDMDIEIKTYQEIMVQGEPEKIEFQIEEIETEELLKGEQKVIKSGEDGEKVKNYKVIYIGGEETGREVIDETIIKEPINRIIEIGTKEPVQIFDEPELTQSNDTIDYADGQTINGKRYSRVMDVRATAYTPNDGGGNGYTYSGMKARYGVVAVDPNVIPLYSKLYIEGYGEAIAGDTGGAIKGNKIDLCFETYSEVNQFGVRNLKVYILE